MARYDKYDPISGGFRALLKADLAAKDVNKAFGVGLDADGLVVKGKGHSGVIGVLVLTKARKAGEVVDVMTSGEIVEFDGAAGTAYFAADADGAISGTSSANAVGHTVEKSRLVVRFHGGASTGV